MSKEFDKYLQEQNKRTLQERFNIQISSKERKVETRLTDIGLAIGPSFEKLEQKMEEMFRNISNAALDFENNEQVKAHANVVNKEFADILAQLTKAQGRLKADRERIKKFKAIKPRKKFRLRRTR